MNPPANGLAVGERTPPGPTEEGIGRGETSGEAPVVERPVSSRRRMPPSVLIRYSSAVPGVSSMNSRVLAPGRIADVREHRLSLIGADIAQR